MNKTSSSIKWFFNFREWNPTISEWHHCGRLIQTEEKNRISQFYFKEDAKASMAGRLLTRRAVQEYLNIKSSEIVLKRTEKGKPYLLDGNFTFSISHAGNLTVLTAEESHNVGVDVMQINRPLQESLMDYFKKMRRQLSSDEFNMITSQESEAKQLKMFYRIWCLKESFVKADGAGISFKLNRLSFKIHTPLHGSNYVTDSELFLDGKKLSGWQFQETILCGDHVIAAAVHPPAISTLMPFKEVFISDFTSSLDFISDPDTNFAESFTKQLDKG